MCGIMVGMIEKLRQRGFVEIYRAKVPTAVYALVKAGVVVYIGQSKSIYDRIAAHHAALKRAGRKKAFPSKEIMEKPSVACASIDFDQVLAFFCERDELLRLEMRLINEFRPKHNIRVDTPLPNIEVDIVALAREVGIQYRRVEGPRQIYRRRVA